MPQIITLYLAKLHRLSLSYHFSLSLEPECILGPFKYLSLRSTLETISDCPQGCTVPPLHTLSSDPTDPELARITQSKSRSVSLIFNQIHAVLQKTKDPFFNISRHITRELLSQECEPLTSLGRS